MSFITFSYIRFLAYVATWAAVINDLSVDIDLELAVVIVVSPPPARTAVVVHVTVLAIPLDLAQVSPAVPANVV